MSGVGRPRECQTTDPGGSEGTGRARTTRQAKMHCTEDCGDLGGIGMLAPDLSSGDGQLIPKTLYGTA